MKKLTILLVLSAISNILFYVSCIWALVEFILYIAKDHVFNWYSLLAIAACFIVPVINAIVLVRESNKAAKQIDDLKNRVGRSRFQQRLDEAIRSSDR